MTVARLLTEADSRELTLWSLYLDAAEERRAARAESDRVLREVEGA